MEETLEPTLQEREDRIETLMVARLATAAVVILTGVSLASNRHNNPVFAVVTFLIAIYLLLVSLWEFYKDTGKLEDEGFEVRSSLGLISIIIILMIPLFAWYSYEEYFVGHRAS